MADLVIKSVIEANQPGGEVLRNHGLDQWVSSDPTGQGKPKSLGYFNLNGTF